MRILLSIPVWKRPEILDNTIKHLEGTLCDYAEVMPYFIISPEDEHCNTLTAMTEGYRRTFIKNNPFGHKKNEGLKRALALEWDYFMEIGSDNIYTSKLWDIYKPYFDNKTEFFGLKNLYVYEPYLNKAVFVEGYHIGWDNKDTALGVNRCIRRDVVERCVPLWDDAAPFGMDGYSDYKIRGAGYECTVIDAGRDPIICGVAANVCLTAWMQWEECGVAVDVDYVRKAFDLCAGHDLRTFEDFHSAVLRCSQDMRKPEAFNLINEAYRSQHGEVRYANYESYRKVVSRKYKRL